MKFIKKKIKKDKNVLNFFLTGIYNISFMLLLIVIIVISKSVFTDTEITQQIVETKNIIENINLDLENQTSCKNEIKEVIVKEKDFNVFFNVSKYYVSYSGTTNETFITFVTSENLFVFEYYLLSDDVESGDAVLVELGDSYFESKLDITPNHKLQVSYDLNKDNITEDDEFFFVQWEQIIGKIILKMKNEN